MSRPALNDYDRQAITLAAMRANPHLSARKIAHLVGVSHTYVSTLRNELDAGDLELPDDVPGDPTRWRPEETWFRLDKDIVKVRDDLVRRVRELEAENAELRSRHDP